ncbi:MAG: hypothetical protein C5B58_02860 [Acidobacteria bacterium]|nr:MAG: hypothetical protein C5B58_02860 [Acidobacteriota bacterium]
MQQDHRHSVAAAIAIEDPRSGYGCIRIVNRRFRGQRKHPQPQCDGGCQRPARGSPCIMIRRISRDIQRMTEPMHKRITNPYAITAPLAACISVFMLSAPQRAFAQDTEVRILCSNGFRAAMEKVLPESERAAKRIKIQFGPSASLKQSIEGGDPFDLVIVTPQVIADLTKEGKVAQGTAADLASSGVGLAIRAGLPKPDVANPPIMKRTLLDAKSVGYVKVGAGTPAILDMLKALGISDDIQRKTVYQTGAEESMANVASGKVDVAFALISEISAPGVQLAGPVPPEFQKRIVMTAGIASSTKSREAVNGIIITLTSAAAAPAIRAAGMDPIGKQDR